MMARLKKKTTSVAYLGGLVQLNLVEDVRGSPVRWSLSRDSSTGKPWKMATMFKCSPVPTFESVNWSSGEESNIALFTTARQT
jgi:hypothetical protein